MTELLLFQFFPDRASTPLPDNKENKLIKFLDKLRYFCITHSRNRELSSILQLQYFITEININPSIKYFQMDITSKKLQEREIKRHNPTFIYYFF